MNWHHEHPDHAFWLIVILTIIGGALGRAL